MGWRDRDYAKWTDEERRRFYGSGGSGSGAARSYSTGPGQGRLFGARAPVKAVPSAFFALIASLVVALVLGQLPRRHPLIPSLHFTLPALSTTHHPATGRISLPPAVSVGSFLTLDGKLPAGETGTVTVEGAYDQSAWRPLATVPTANGSYEARVQLEQRGLLRVRVTYPDGHQSVGETRVG